MSKILRFNAELLRNHTAIKISSRRGNESVELTAEDLGLKYIDALNAPQAVCRHLQHINGFQGDVELTFTHKVKARTC